MVFMLLATVYMYDSCLIDEHYSWLNCQCFDHWTVILVRAMYITKIEQWNLKPTNQYKTICEKGMQKSTVVTKEK